ncbi:MAG: tetratricopeptide repeat protein [Deltaproteobacteria bacterium]|nr:tetratricopeptide repeat protein [Deltaproteobacteria bacterium]
MRRTAAILPLVALSMAGCAGRARPASAYDAAVLALKDEDFALAAKEAFGYRQSHAQTDNYYDRAWLVAAEAFDGLELTHASAMAYRDVAGARRDEDLVITALRGIERAVSAGKVDDDSLVTGFLAGSDFGTLPTDVAGFTAFVQGRDNAKRGLVLWARERFAQIPEDSVYRARGDLVNAVLLMEEAKLDEAEALLRQAARRPSADGRAKATALHTLAQLLFERQRFDEALRTLDRVNPRWVRESDLLLEKAWAEYYRGNSRRSLGLLIALDAPAYALALAPERFILGALDFRRLCHFNLARESALELRRRHGDALRALRAGDDPEEVQDVRDAALRQGEARRLALLAARLEEERRIARSSASNFGPRLAAWLDALYENAIDDIEARLAVELRIAAEGIAQSLLDADEQVALLEHELSVDLLRGRRRPMGVGEITQSSARRIRGPRALYTFDGEYWTDELQDLVVVIEDRCVQ